MIIIICRPGLVSPTCVTSVTPVRWMLPLLVMPTIVYVGDAGAGQTVVQYRMYHCRRRHRQCHRIVNKSNVCNARWQIQSRLNVCIVIISVVANIITISIICSASIITIVVVVAALLAGAVVAIMIPPLCLQIL